MNQLSLKGKYLSFKKLLFPLVIRGIHYTTFSSLALELRGYGAVSQIEIQEAYPLKARDFGMIAMILLINACGVIYF